MPNLMRKEAATLSKSERQKLQRLYTYCGAACGSVRKIVKASNLSVSKMKQNLHSKPSYTKITLTTRKSKRLKAFAGFQKEIWYMNLAYIDKLAKDKNGVKCLLVLQDLFNKTVDAIGKKTKDSEGTVREFFTMIKNRIDPNIFGWTRKQIFLDSLKNYVNLKVYKFTLQ